MIRLGCLEEKDLGTLKECDGFAFMLLNVHGGEMAY